MVVPPAVRGNVELAIGVKVGDDNAMWMRVMVDVEGGSRAQDEAAMTIAEKNAQVGRLVVRDD